MIECPKCGRRLFVVKQSPDGPLNSYQFDSIKAGDYYGNCTDPKEHNRGRSGLCYWWKHELKDLKEGEGK